MKSHYTPAVLASVMTLVLVGTALRVIAATDCFWLDEIWSYFIAMRVSHPIEIFKKFSIVDNNHHLNTLFIYLTGDTRNWIWYRVPSIITGSLTLILIWRAAASHGAAEGIIATGLTAVSYPLILYSSEARGYAPALFFIVASAFLMQQNWQHKNPLAPVLFWATVSLGLLSNLSVAFTWLAVIIWSFMHELREKSPPWPFITGVLKYHMVPLWVLLYLARSYIAINKPLNNLGHRSPTSAIEFLITTGTALTGSPQKGDIFIVVMVLLSIIFVLGVHRLYKREPDTAILLLMAACLPPLLCILARKELHFRFALAAFPFAYIIIANGITACFNRNTATRIICCLFLAVFLYGNGMRLHGLIRNGRGDYLGAIRYMAEKTQGPLITVASDNDFRNKMVLDFYARYLPNNKRLLYVKQEQWLAKGSDWLILHNQQTNAVPESWYCYGAHTYRFVKTFPYSGVSGWHWFVYRNTATATAVEVPPPITGDGDAPGSPSSRQDIPMGIKQRNNSPEYSRTLPP